MQATVADILDHTDRYIDRFVNIEGILLVAAFDRAANHFEQVWIAEAKRPSPRAIQALPIRSDSTLWHGLSRLFAPHRSASRNYRIHDAVRAWVKVLQGPRLELITAAIIREDCTLFVGMNGARLEQALSEKEPVHSVAHIQANKEQFLGRQCLVYGALTILAAPPAQVLSPSRIPLFTHDKSQAPPDALPADWHADIAYPQSDNRPEAAAKQQDSLLVDPDCGISERLTLFPGLNQTIVKPAVIVGTLMNAELTSHFAALTDLRAVYLQNIRHDDQRKSFESVIKLKNFA